jgi:hypothetical protein
VSTVDESTDGSPPRDPSKGEGKFPDGVAPWIKNLGALVTIFVTLVGLSFTAYQLKLKADSDKETAQLNKLIEDDKLALGKAQLQDQAKARTDAAEQHKLDIAQTNRAASEKEERENLDKISGIVAHMFSTENRGSAGDLASFFAMLNRSKANRAVIENAVLAKLETTLSEGEIDLAFRLFEGMGELAIEATAQANRRARQRYDAELCYALNVIRVRRGGNLSSFDGNLLTEVAVQIDLDGDYVVEKLRATCNFKPSVLAEIDGDQATNDKDSPRLKIAVSEIKRSNQALMKEMARLGSRREKLDLSGLYLTAEQEDNLALDARLGMTLTDTFFENRELTAQDRLRFCGAITIPVGSTTFETVDCAGDRNTTRLPRAK